MVFYTIFDREVQ